MTNKTFAPQRTPFALLILDSITDFEFEDGDKLLANALAMAPALARLKKRAKKAGAAVIYVNDNFGRWREDFRSIVTEFTKPAAKGREFVENIRPEPDDYYILKPHRSGFYSTSLDLLIESIGAEILILTGITTDICVLFTANDAYMRGFKIFVPRDCVTAVNDDHNRQTLAFIERVLKADTRKSSSVRF